MKRLGSSEGFIEVPHVSCGDFVRPPLGGGSVQSGGAESLAGSFLSGAERQPQTHTGLGWSTLQRFEKIEILRNTRAPITVAPERSQGSYGRGQEVHQDTGPELFPALAHQIRPATASHTCPLPGPSSCRRRFAAASHRILEATTRFDLRGHLGEGHNESGSPQAGPIGRRRVGDVGRDTYEEAQRRRPVRME